MQFRLEIQRLDAVRLFGPYAVRNDVAQDGCSPEAPSRLRANKPQPKGAAISWAAPNLKTTGEGPGRLTLIVRMMPLNMTLRTVV
jgi:hypothetical protein